MKMFHNRIVNLATDVQNNKKSNNIRKINMWWNIHAVQTAYTKKTRWTSERYYAKAARCEQEPSQDDCHTLAKTITLLQLRGPALLDTKALDPIGQSFRDSVQAQPLIESMFSIEARF